MSRRNNLLAVSVVLLCAVSVLGAAEPIKLKLPVQLATLDARNGNLLVISGGTKAILYPKAYLDGTATKVVGPVDIPSTGLLLFKVYKDRAYFILAGNSSSKLTLLDPATLKQVAQIDAGQVRDAFGDGEAGIGDIVSGTDPNDAIVHCAPVRYHSRGRLLSLATMKPVGITAAEGNELEVSVDGKYLYSRNTEVGPTGFDAFERQLDPSTGQITFKKVFDEHESVHGYVPGAYGRICIVGTYVRSADLKKETRELDFYVEAVFRKVPVLVGSNEAGQLIAASANTYKSFGRIPLPGSTEDDDHDRSHYYYRHTRRSGHRSMLADDVGNRVLIVRDLHVWKTPLKDLKVTDEPVLYCRVGGDGRAFVGEQLRVSLTPVAAATKIELASGPDGMKVEGRNVIWTPTARQVGDINATLTLSAAGVKITQALQFSVGRRHMVLPFVPTGLAVSPDGKRAFVWQGSHHGHGYYGRDREIKTSKIALVDLDATKLVVNKTLPYVVRSAAVDAHRVYVSQTDADRVNALRLDDLTRKHFVLTDSGVGAITALGDKRLAAATEENGIVIFQAPSLKLVKHPVTPGPSENRDAWGRRRRRYFGDEEDIGDFLPVGRNWYAAGAIFDPTFHRPVMLVQPDSLPTLSDSNSRDEYGRDHSVTIHPLTWNRTFDREGNLLSQTGRSIAAFGDGPAVLVNDVPVAYTLRNERADQDSGYYDRDATLNITLAARDLVSGAVVATTPLLRNVNAAGEDGETPLMLVARGKRVIALADNRLFVHRIPADVIAKCKPPLGFVTHEKIHTVSLTAPTTIVNKITGGTAPIDYEVLGDPGQVKIDTKTGTVTVDGPALVQRAVALIINRIRETYEVNIPTGDDEETENRRRYYRPRRYRSDDEDPLNGQTPKQLVAMVRKTSATEYAAYTGVTPTGIPVLLTIQVAATDSHSQVAKLQFQVMLDLPAEKVQTVIQAAVDKIKADRGKALAEEKARERQYELEAKRRREAREKAIEAARKKSGQQSKDAQAKLDDLNKRLDRIEAQMELLTRALLQQRKGTVPKEPKTDP